MQIQSPNATSDDLQEKPAELITMIGSAGLPLGLCQIDMDIVVVDILLTLIRSVNVRLCVLYKITPFDAGDVRELAPPDSGTSIANTLVPSFAIEHILPDDGESVVCIMHCATFSAIILAVNALVKDDTIWLNQKAMAELFDVQPPAISKHLKNIFAEGELQEEVVVSKMEIATPHGAIPGKTQTSEVMFYNLDAIISVGYRVNSRRATAFRIWATGILREYMIKGFAMDDERLKQGQMLFGKDYFRELLERVRSIRASERRIWQQVTDIYAECSIDYDPKAPTTKEFYAMVQNKFHYAIVGKTAAEIVYDSADHTRENMGLTTWKNAPDGRILKSDTSIAKNYLDEPQIRRLERAVTGYFDYIEDLIERENTFTMQEFAASINEFLSFRRYQILPDKGRVSHKRALEKAAQEYEIFNRTQKITSDFDCAVAKLTAGQKGASENC